MESRKVNYVGWLGNCNLGDEALFAVSKRLFSGYDLRPYDSFRNLKLPRKYLTSSVDPIHSHVSLFGGGTLLPDDITWIKPAKYNYLFGTSVKDATFKTPFDSFDDIIIERLRRFHFRMIGVRDTFSKQSLAKWGLTSEVIGDPVLSFRPNSDVERCETLIGINIGCDGFLWGDDQSKVTREMIPVLKQLKDNGFDLVLIPFSKQDLPHINELSRKTNTKIFSNWFEPQSVADLLASCRFLIGERLHSLVFSAATFTPFVCLEYRPKCKAFSELVGFSDFCLRTDRVVASQIIERTNDLLNRWPEMQNVLKKKVEYFRRKQTSFVERLKNDLEGLPEKAWSNFSFSEQINNKVFWNSDVALRRNTYSLWRLYNHLIFVRLMRFLL